MNLYSEVSAENDQLLNQLYLAKDLINKVHFFNSNFCNG